MDPNPNKTRDVHEVLIEKVDNIYVFQSYVEGGSSIKKSCSSLEKVLEEVKNCFE